MRHLALAFVLACAALAAGCQSRGTIPSEQAVIVRSDGSQSVTTRSALAGSEAPGKQEIVGLYIPFLGTGLALKAGLEYDGTPTVITIPSSAQAAPACAPAPQYVEVQETYMEPQTTMVQRTRTVRKAVVPVPVQSAPYCAPPQAAPAKTPGCVPPPEPVARAIELPACDGGTCQLAGR